MPPRGKYKKTSQDLRQRIVDASKNGDDFIELARLLHIPKTTAYSIVKRKTGRYSVQKGGRKHKKFDEDMAHYCEEILSNEPTITIKALNSRLREHFGANKRHITDSCLSKNLDGLFYTVKKCYAFPEGRNSLRVKELRRAYSGWMMEARADGVELVYTDEMNFGVWTQKSNGRSKKGTRCHRTVSNSHGRNLNVIMSISKERGLIYWERHYESITAAVFKQYIENMRIRMEGRCTIIIDNAPCHSQAETIDGVSVKKLPPYSPMFNAIEEAFSCLKYAIKARIEECRDEVFSTAVPRALGITIARHRQQLLERIADEVINPDLISRAKVIQWDNHIFRFIPACMNMQDMVE